MKLLVASLFLATTVHSAGFDLMIRNATVVDGTGNPAYVADVAVTGDEIVAIGRALPGTAGVTIEAGRHVLAPGFVDLHVHARRTILDNPAAENYLRQGVTTIFEGPDGSSALPVGAFLSEVEKARPALNLGTFVGQGSIRAQVIGADDRRGSPEELDRMKALVREAMLEGAFGLSTGLRYVPGTFTPTDEVIELARVAGGMGGIHISHMRDEADRVLESVRETIEIGERGGLPTQVTHGKTMGKRNWGRSSEILELVARARARGVDVTIDQYPYTASSTGIEALLPRWAVEGDRERRLERLRDPESRGRIRNAIVESLREDRGGGNLANVQIAAAQWDTSLAGRHLGEITQTWKGTTTFEDAADVVIEMVEKGGASAIYHAMSEEDVERILASPYTMVASDGEVSIFGRNSPHPRGYGTFPRVLGRYVRERKLLSLEEAVRKMTSMPAGRVGLLDRGILRPGMKADLVLFDPATVADQATFADPHQYPVGVSLVVVNGGIAFHDGTVSATRSGRVLRGSSWQAGAGE